MTPSKYTQMSADSNGRRRRAAVIEAKARMDVLGVKWGVVQAWALAEGWKRADVASLSPLAVEAFWRFRGSPAYEVAS